MKGIVLAGGAGSRLYPMTKIMTKQLQPVYDKPMIYYPLSMLMLGGMKEILIVCAPADKVQFQNLLGDGSDLGIHISYVEQPSPNGLPEAFILGKDFVGNDDVCLILGDNIFYGDIQFFREAISNQMEKKENFKARVFAYYVADPSAYGVVEFDKKTKKVNSIEEKPAKPKSSFAIPGLYLFDQTVSRRAMSLTKSARGETEIVDLMKSYLSEDQLSVEVITRGVAWLDTGTPRSMLDATAYIGAIEERQGMKVACLEEVAFRTGLIDAAGLQRCYEKMPKCPYKEYLRKILESET